MNQKRFDGFSEESLHQIALRKVNFRLSVKIHVGVYITVCSLLTLINWIFTPEIWWIHYPILGWLIGLIEHYTSYVVYARGVYPMAKRAVIFHLMAYIFVILYLFVIQGLGFNTYVYFLIFSLVRGFAAGGFWPIINSYGNDSTEEGEKSQFFGTLQAFFSAFSNSRDGNICNNIPKSVLERIFHDNRYNIHLVWVINIC